LHTNGEIRNLAIKCHKAFFAVGFAFLAYKILVKTYSLQLFFNISHNTIGIKLGTVHLARLEYFDADVFEFALNESDILCKSFTSNCVCLNKALLVLLHILVNESLHSLIVVSVLFKFGCGREHDEPEHLHERLEFNGAVWVESEIDLFDCVDQGDFNLRVFSFKSFFLAFFSCCLLRQVVVQDHRDEQYDRHCCNNAFR
jgi:hypothetical protein